MLKRSKILMMFMLVAVVCMSIGFAALTDELTATGDLTWVVPDSTTDPTNPTVVNFDEDVYFSAVDSSIGGNAADKSKVVVVFDTSTTNVDTFDIAIGDGVFTNAQQNVNVTATIKNDSDYKVDVKVETIDPHAYFTVEGVLGAASIEAGQTTTLNVTITLDALPPVDITAEAFTVKVTATPAILTAPSA